MQWQDFVLSVSFVVFNVALIPSILSSDKPSLKTSVITVTFLLPGLIVYLSLSLWFSSAMTVCNIILWSTLAWLVYARDKKKLHETIIPQGK